MGSAVAFAAPIAAVYLTPLDDIRLDNLSTNWIYKKLEMKNTKNTSKDSMGL